MNLRLHNLLKVTNVSNIPIHNISIQCGLLYTLFAKKILKY